MFTMKKRFSLLPTLAALTFTAALFAVACSHGQIDRALDEKLKNMPQITNSEELSRKLETSITSASHLTDDQKSKLSALHKDTDDEMIRLRNESFKLRELLIEDVFHGKNDLDETKLIQKRLRKNADDRLSTIFGAVETANNILGHGDPDKSYELMKSFIDLPSWVR